MSIKTKFKLSVADIIIQIQSAFVHYAPKVEVSAKALTLKGRANFVYQGNRRPNITIEVNLVKRLPKIPRLKPAFITYHTDDGPEDWRIFKVNSSYIYASPLGDQGKVMLFNEDLNKVQAFIIPFEKDSWYWNAADIVFNFLQVLLIYYLAKEKAGIIIHALGVKDLDRQGLLFAGESGAGKTTLARLWSAHSRAGVLNDDRVIVRRVRGEFIIYGSPWRGDFSEYLASSAQPAPLQRIFFIEQATKNSVKRLSLKEAFVLLYPKIFPTFWDKEYSENILSFCQSLVERTACYKLGFVNDGKVTEFIRNI